VRGDIEMTSDDAERRHTGSVRICYCIANNGRSETRYIYQDGDKCFGRLRVQISDDRLLMKHGRIDCTGNKGFVVPTDIMCSKKPGEDSATCDTRSHGRFPATTSDEKYHRVDPESCK